MYSQRDEEKYILPYFKETGNFLDIGAYDGKTFSNTHALALLGWKGICVEPSKCVYLALEKLYKDNPSIELYNTCIGNYDGEIDFYDSGGDAVSSTDTKHVQLWSKACTFEKVTSEIIKVDTLLSKSKLSTFDFVNIDVENDELAFNVLRQLDLKKLGVKMTCIECQGNVRAGIQMYLKEFGFRTIQQTPENLISCL